MSTAEKMVSDEELSKLRMLQENFDAITKQYGELRFQQLLIEKEMRNLSDAMEVLDAERQKVVVELEQKFGSSGTVNIETGEFIPD